MHTSRIAALTIIALLLGLWVSTSPAPEVQVGKSTIFGAIPAAITAVTVADDYIAQSLRHRKNKLPPYDEVVLDDDKKTAWIPEEFCVM